MRYLSLYDIPLYPSLLGLGTLTALILHYYEVCPPLDAFLDLLGGNRSLEHVDLAIEFDEFPAPTSQHRDVIMSRLKYLSITSWDVFVARTMISSIPLPRGVHLEITFRNVDDGLGLNDILTGISVTHLSNLSSPTHMEYVSHPRMIQLTGPNGSFIYSHEWSTRGWYHGVPFMEFPILPLTNVQELRLVHSLPPTVFHPSSFPALEKFTIEDNADLSLLLSALLSNPSASSLKTLKFRDCILTEEFMEELTQSVSDRGNTTSSRLQRVVIAHLDGKFPTTDSIQELGKRVPVVDVTTLGWVWIHERI